MGMREDHTPMKVSTYGKHQIHHWVSIGIEVRDNIPMTLWKCSGCNQQRYTPKTVVRTFP